MPSRASLPTSSFKPPSPRFRAPESEQSWTWAFALGALAAAMRVWRYTSVPDNPFYDAAVRSMSHSWHAFFTAAFEPSAGVSVDKPPLALWMQVLSTRVFGWGSSQLRLPMLICGILAVVVLYDTVRRLWGPVAGVCAGVALALMPNAVLLSRSDTMDAVLMLMMVCASWCAARACQDGRTRWAIGVGVFVALGFNTKFFEILVVVPPLLVMLWVGMPTSRRRRARDLAFAGATALVLSAAWPAAVSTSAHPPWPDGSTNGSIWNVIFVFNGTDRLDGNREAGPKAKALSPPGFTRLFRSSPADWAHQIGLALVSALALALAALATVRLGRAGPNRRIRNAGAVWAGSWVAVGVIVYGHMAVLYVRYLEGMVPAVAALTGIAIAALAERSARYPPIAGVLVAATAPAVAYAAHIEDVGGAGPDFPFSAHRISSVLTWPVIASGAAAIAFGAILSYALWMRPVKGAITWAAALAALVIVTFVPAEVSFGFDRSGESGVGSVGAMSRPELLALSSFLTSHQGSAKYELASVSLPKVAPLVVSDDRPVLVLTTWGGVPVLTVARLRALVAGGEVRYALTSGSCPLRSSCSPVAKWVFAHSRDVTSRLHVSGLARRTLVSFTVLPQ